MASTGIDGRPGRRLSNLPAYCRDRLTEARVARVVSQIPRFAMRPFSLSVAVGALLAITALTPVALRAETATDAPVACIALSGAAPAKLIPVCTVVIDDPATSEADRLDATITRAVALHNSGQTDKALAEIDGVIAKDPQRARAFRARGEIFRQTGKSEQAFAALNEAIRLDPDNANGYESRGNVFNNVRKYDRAIEDYNEALRLKPDMAQAFSDRGAAWYFKGEYQKAVTDYDEAIRLDPDHAQTYTNRGAALKKLGRSELALKDETSAIRIDPTRPEYFDNRGLEPCRQRRLCRRDRRLRPGHQAASRGQIPHQPRRRVSGPQGLRPRHCRLRRRAKARSEIPAPLQQPRRGVAAQGRPRACES